MAVLLQSILSGVLIGGVYALIGIGLTLIFGVMRVINFAQGVLEAILQLPVIVRVRDALPQNQILLTIGIGLVLSNPAMLDFTSDYRILSTRYSSSSVPLGGIFLS